VPIFSFRLEAKDGSGHFRQGRIEAPDETAARVILQKREFDRAVYQMPDELAAEICEAYGVKSVDDLPSRAPIGAPQEDSADFRTLEVRYRANLNIHRQAEPYELTDLEEVKD